MKKTEYDEALARLRDIRRTHAFQMEEAGILSMIRYRLQASDAEGAQERLHHLIVMIGGKLDDLKALEQQILRMKP